MEWSEASPQQVALDRRGCLWSLATVPFLLRALAWRQGRVWQFRVKADPPRPDLPGKKPRGRAGKASQARPFSRARTLLNRYAF